MIGTVLFCVALTTTASGEMPSSQPVPQPNVLVTPIGPPDAPANLSELAASGYSGRDDAILHYGTPESFAELHGFLAVIAAQSNAPHSHLDIDLAEAFLSAYAQVNRTVSVYIDSISSTATCSSSAVSSIGSFSRTSTFKPASFMRHSATTKCC